MRSEVSPYTWSHAQRRPVVAEGRTMQHLAALEGASHFILGVTGSL